MPEVSQIVEKLGQPNPFGMVALFLFNYPGKGSLTR